MLQSSSDVASFPGHSRLQFLITCSIKTEGEGLGERVTCVMSGRHEDRHEGGTVPDEESRGPSCNILSKNLRL